MGQQQNMEESHFKFEDLTEIQSSQQVFLRNKSVFFVLFFMVIFFIVEKCFLVLFSLKMCFFFSLTILTKSQVLQFTITVSEIFGD